MWRILGTRGVIRTPAHPRLTRARARRVASHHRRSPPAPPSPFPTPYSSLCGSACRRLCPLLVPVLLRRRLPHPLSLRFPFSVSFSASRSPPPCCPSIYVRFTRHASRLHVAFKFVLMNLCASVHPFGVRDVGQLEPASVRPKSSRIDGRRDAVALLRRTPAAQRR